MSKPKDPSLYDLARSGNTWAQEVWERRADATLPVDALSKVKCGLCGRWMTPDQLNYVHPEVCK